MERFSGFAGLVIINKMKDVSIPPQEKEILGKLLQGLAVPASVIGPLKESLFSKGFILKKHEQNYLLERAEDRAFPYEVLFCESGKTFPRSLLSFLEVSSTNQCLKERRDLYPTGTAIVTEEQTRGQGKWGRNWFMEKGKSLLFSLLLKTRLQEREHSGFLTMAAALSVHRAAKDVCGVECRCKWPNDVLAGGRKLCGILTESMEGKNGDFDVIVGVGVNVNYHKKELPSFLEDTATSLSIEAGKILRRMDLFVSFCRHFEMFYQDFEKGRFSAIMEEWQKAVIKDDRNA